MRKLNPFAAFLLTMTSAAWAEPETYQVDSSRTFPQLTYSILSLSIQPSRFNITRGTLTLDKEAKTGEVDVVITRAVDTRTAAAKEQIQAEDRLEATSDPIVIFKSSKVIFEGDKPTTIEGALTFRGITKPLTLKVTQFTTLTHPVLNKDAISASITTYIKRGEFNPGKDDPNHGEEMPITVAFEAIKD